MSWIRIDDDTYIDDSLVTCAEYQLFIDEMSAQDEYYQPDHWKECHFPKGHARQPILGMRSSDAVAFCEWLTRRNNDGWTYRLPTQSEAQKISITKAYTPPIGYWLAKNVEQDFAWVGQTPKNPRALYIAIEGTSARALEHVRDGDLTSNLASAIDRASVLDFASNLASARDILINLVSGHDILINLVSGHDIARDIARFIDRDHACSSDIARARTLDFISTRTLHIAVDLASDMESAKARAHACNILVNLYVDSVTLQSRISGTSPAFEGIRLVRERIK
ncbi:MAG: SUMF1/EgtB/PvdO family nonheme iron enzyme [Anaerolineales bacterium]|jgi:hypothetical protein|nr:SUMF1/EgtB/PvdO family nonheme iron enzyme [Anaerolineales bacterium]